jgi:MarR family transcriptional regulator for hemolysin
MPRPDQSPIGVDLARAAKEAERAFDDALAAAGSSRPTWLILMTLKTSQPSTQIQLAAAVGIRDATLSYHLNAMEADGLVTRVRNPTNRRVHQVSLTAAGDALFFRLVHAVRAFDRRLRANISDNEIAQLRGLLKRLRTNVGNPDG